MGALALLGASLPPLLASVYLFFDPTYYFWHGFWYAGSLLAAALVTLLLFAGVCWLLRRRAAAQDLDERALGLGAAALAGLLGIALVLLAARGSAQMYETAGHLGAGCATHLPRAIALMDYSKVLYNIRAQPNCTARTVEACKGWKENKYTIYLRYLEVSTSCGPLCAEEPFAAAAWPGHGHVSPAPDVAAAPPKPSIGPAEWPAPRPVAHASGPVGLLRQARRHRRARAARDRRRKRAHTAAPLQAVAATTGALQLNHSVVRREAELGLKPGDVVTIARDEAQVQKAFVDADGYHWRPGMAAMLGQPHKVLIMREPHIVGVPSPDGSQNGVWFFPMEVVKKVWLPSGVTAPLLFTGDVGQTKQTCFPLVTTKIRVLAWSFGDVIYWEGVCLIVAALAAGVSPLLATLLPPARGGSGLGKPHAESPDAVEQ